MENQNLSFFDRVVKEDKKIQPTPTFYVDMAQNPNVCQDMLKTQLTSIDTIPDYQLQEMIKASFAAIIDDIMDRQSGSVYVPALNNMKFISCFTRVLSLIQLNYKSRVCCSKLAYDYIVCNSVPRADLSPAEIKQIETTKTMYRMISKIANRNAINSLISLGITEDDAANICTARFSSMKEDICAKRMNFTLCTKDPNVMDEQMIVNIYEKLFDHVTDLFIGTMFDENSIDTDENSEGGRAEDFSEIYSSISLAILIILNNMPMRDITNIISTFCKQYNYYRGIGNYQPVRFNLRGISGDYPRVLQAVEELEAHGVMIPS